MKYLPLDVKQHSMNQVILSRKILLDKINCRMVLLKDLLRKYVMYVLNNLYNYIQFWFTRPTFSEITLNAHIHETKVNLYKKSFTVKYFTLYIVGILIFCRSWSCS